MKTTGSGHLFTRGGWYHLQYNILGKRKMISLKTKVLREAEKRRDEILNPALQAKTAEKVARHIAEARELLTDVKYPLAVVWKKYLDNPSRPQSGAGSLGNYKRYLKAFFDWIEKKHPQIERINQITTKEAEQYLDTFWTENNISHTTLNHHLQGLKLVFKVVCNTDKTPFSRIKKKKGLQTSRKDFTPENLEALFKAFDDDTLRIPDRAEMRLLCYIGAFTGLRLSDAVFLKWDDIDFPRRVISCFPRKTRGTQRQVHIPLHPELKSQLDRAESLKNNDVYVLPRLTERHMEKNDALVTDFLKILDHVGLKDTATAERGINRRLYGFHSFRHGFASMAANAGVPVAVLADILGDNIATLQKYYIKVSDSAKMNAVNSIMITGNNSTGRGIPETVDIKPVSEADELRNRIQKALQWMKKSKFSNTARKELQARLEDGDKMNKKIFKELTDSLNEAVEIHKGKKKPSRVFTLNPPNIQNIRKNPKAVFKALHA